MNWIERCANGWFSARRDLTSADDPVLTHLLAIVRGATAPEQYDVFAESGGLRAVLDGMDLSPLSEEERSLRATQIFDALFAALQERAASGQALELDPLIEPESGLPNRILFLDRLGQAIAYAHRHDTLLAVCSVRVNLSGITGHEKPVALEIADRLRHTIRELDAVGRLGFEEFGIVLNDLRSRENGMVAVKKIEEILSEPFDIGLTPARIEPCFGIAFYPAHGHEPEMLLASARTARSGAVPVAIFGE